MDELRSCLEWMMATAKRIFALAETEGEVCELEDRVRTEVREAAGKRLREMLREDRRMS